MYVKVLYNFSLNNAGVILGNRRGYHTGDKLIEGWDGFIDDMTKPEALEHILIKLKDPDLSNINLLTPLAIGRGDVVYFPETSKAYARTKTSWKAVKDFKPPPNLSIGKGTGSSGRSGANG